MRTHKFFFVIVVLVVVFLVFFFAFVKPQFFAGVTHGVKADHSEVVAISVQRQVGGHVDVIGVEMNPVEETVNTVAVELL